VIWVTISRLLARWAAFSLFLLGPVGGTEPAPTVRRPQGGTVNWYLQAMRKYADFSGRARRREYWFYELFTTLIGAAIVLIILVSVAGSARALNVGMAGTAGMGAGALGIFYIVYGLGNLLPSLAVSVRRLHDTGRSGWWVFISLVPLAGGIVLLVFFLLDSQPGANRFGPNPKERGSAGYSPGAAYAAQP
jgi:uncharacterized membrane protein YhaH (DUF805 family)